MPDSSERIAELRRELESNPLSRQFYQLGELLRRDGRAAEAVSVLRAGLGHHPRYVAAWVSLGRACLDRSEPLGAADALHEALELDAQNPVAWRLLGEARLGGGDRFGALDAMEHALQLAPGDDVLRAAVDALASETWPPEAVVAPGAGTQDAMRPVGADAPPPVAAEPPAETLSPSPEAVAPVAEPAPVPEPEVFAKVPAPEPPAPMIAEAVSAPVGAAADLADPFAMTGTGLSVDAAADVFVMPAEAASFADEPFGRAPAPADKPDFLADFAPFGPPSVTPSAAAPAAAEPENVAAAAPAQVETMAAPVIAEPQPAPELPAGTAVEPEAEVLEPMQMDAEPAIAEPPAESFREPAAASAGGPPTLTMARLHLQQQDFPAAIEILERIVTAEPDNQEARDLLDLVHDMMAPLPGELPLASLRERKIAALQGWLASLTLGQERMSL